MASKPDKLRNNALWKEGLELAEYMYDKLEAFREYPDEKFNTENKIRNSANDTMFYLSQAIGNVVPGSAEYDWNNARKNLFALQSMYLHACKQKFLELEPDIVVKIDNLLAKLELKINNSREETHQREKDELEPWLEKYRLWQKMQDR